MLCLQASYDRVPGNQLEHDLDQVYDRPERDHLPCGDPARIPSPEEDDAERGQPAGHEREHKGKVDVDVVLDGLGHRHFDVPEEQDGE